MALTSKKTHDEELENLDKSMRIYSDQYLNYKWHAGGSEPGLGLGYHDIINFKRANNNRGHHCVMCGNKNASIPSQNKDVCKACDTGFWVIKATQIVVKFCKGCKNFARLWDFRDKPEATKCIKCRQRGRQNYVSKKSGCGDVDTADDFGQYLPMYSGKSSVKSAGALGAEIPIKSVGTKYGSFTGSKRGDLQLQANGAGSSMFGRGQKRGRSRTLGSLDSDEYDEIDDLDIKQAAEMLLVTSYMLNSPKAKRKNMDYPSNFDANTDCLRKSASMDDNLLQPPQLHLSDFSSGLSLSGLARAASDPTHETSIGRRPLANPLTTLAEVTEHMFGSASEATDRRSRSHTLDIGSLSAITRACSWLVNEKGASLGSIEEADDRFHDSKRGEGGKGRPPLVSVSVRKEEKEPGQQLLKQQQQQRQHSFPCISSDERHFAFPTNSLQVFAATAAGNGDGDGGCVPKSESEGLGRPPQYRAGRLRSVSDIGCSTSYTNETIGKGFEEQPDFRDRKRIHANAITPSPSFVKEEARPAIYAVKHNPEQTRARVSTDSAAVATSAMFSKMDIEAEASASTVSEGRKRVCSRDFSDDALPAANIC